MKKEEFKKLVREAVSEMPDKIKEKMDNVAVVVEDEPSQFQLEKGGVSDGNSLLGLYQGVPQTTRDRYAGVLPDKITIFQNSIEKVASTKKQIKARVKKTVRHEFAHHFGFDEKGVEDLGL